MLKKTMFWVFIDVIGVVFNRFEHETRQKNCLLSESRLYCGYDPRILFILLEYLKLKLIKKTPEKSNFNNFQSKQFQVYKDLTSKPKKADLIHQIETTLVEIASELFLRGGVRFGSIIRSIPFWIGP